MCLFWSFRRDLNMIQTELKFAKFQYELTTCNVSLGQKEGNEFSLSSQLFLLSSINGELLETFAKASCFSDLFSWEKGRDPTCMSSRVSAGFSKCAQISQGFQKSQYKVKHFSSNSYFSLIPAQLSEWRRLLGVFCSSDLLNLCSDCPNTSKSAIKKDRLINSQRSHQHFSS